MWLDVSRGLRQRGYPVYALLTRCVAADSDSVRSVVSTIEDPVVLVGHSCGDCVTINASAGAPNVQ